MRIIKVPPGSLPQEIREGLLGATILCAGWCKKGTEITDAVTGERRITDSDGYVSPVYSIILALWHSSPAARKHINIGKTVKEGEFFFFPANCIEIVGSPPIKYLN